MFGQRHLRHIGVFTIVTLTVALSSGGVTLATQHAGAQPARGASSPAQSSAAATPVAAMLPPRRVNLWARTQKVIKRKQMVLLTTPPKRPIPTALGSTIPLDAYADGDQVTPPSTVVPPLTAAQRPVEHVAVVLLTFPNAPTPATSMATVQAGMAQVDQLVRESSYNKRSMQFTFVGPVQAAFNSCSNDAQGQPNDYTREAIRLADPTVDFRTINSVSIVYHDTCHGPGVSSLGQNFPYITNDGTVPLGAAWSNATDQYGVFDVQSHELGHNQGLHHADYLYCGTKQIGGTTLSGTPQVAGTDGCSWFEYSDLIDVMSYTGFAFDFDAPHRTMLGFYDPSMGPERLLDVNAAGSYTLSVAETAGAGNKAIRIPRNVNGPNGQPESLFLEYRRPQGFDASVNPASKLDGVLIHVDNLLPGDTNAGHSFLIDASPSVPADSADPTLRLGQTFYDPVANKSITLTGTTSTTATVRVDIGKVPLVCSTQTPTVNIGQAASFSASGGAGTYSWSAIGGSPSTGSGTAFSSSFATAGTKSVTVSDSSGTGTSCTVSVLAPLTCTGDQTGVVWVGYSTSFTAGGRPGPYTWSAPTGNPASGSGATFNTSYAAPGSKVVTVTASGASAQCQIEAVPVPTTGDVSIERTNAGGTNVSGTTGQLDALAALPYNPASYVNIQPGSHTVSATALTGYTVEFGHCEVLNNGASPCQPSTYTPVSCTTVCTAAITVQAARYHLDVFRYTKIPPAGWSGFSVLATGMIGSPTLVKVAATEEDAFARAADGNLWRGILTNGAFTSWQLLGGPVAGDAAAVSRAPGVIDVFAVGSNKRIKHITITGTSLSAWDYASTSTMQGVPTAVSAAPNTIDLYFRSTINTLKHTTFNGTKWSSALTVSKATKLASDPSAISWGPGRVDVFWQGPTNSLMHRFGTGATTDVIEQLASNIAGKPMLSSWGVGRLDVVWRATDHSVYQEAWQGQWWGQQSLGGLTNTDPVLVSRTSSNYQVFIVDTGGNVSTQSYNNGWPRTWTVLGNGFVGTPAVASSASNHIELLAMGANGSIQLNKFNG